jgi:ATP-dependent helicase/nuclease subunit A
VSRALLPLSTEHAAEDGDGKVWRYCKVAPFAPATRSKSTPEQALAAEPHPSWLQRAAPVEPIAVLALAPSRAHDGTTPMPGAPPGGSHERAKAERTQAMARGVLMHRLLQALPAIPIAARREAARRHLARQAREFTVEERESMIEQICRVLDDPRFSQLFSPESRAELPIVGRFRHAGGKVGVSGQIDRLAVTGEAVMIADFKTNRPAPRCLDDVPPAYICQLALYRLALLQLYPEKAVRAALVWTEIPDLMEIPAAMMECALRAVTSA